MTGKEICEFLKEIRKSVAKENGIDYEPRECHHEGDCSGTCWLCEKEASVLLDKLKDKERRGEQIKIDMSAVETLELIAHRSYKIDEEDCDDGERVLLGDIDYPQGYIIMNEEDKENVKRPFEEEAPPPEPDIVWNMDDDEHPIISSSANIINKGGIKGEDEYDLARFLRAQEYESGGYRDALQEVKAGGKRKHWIWYIFPQINGLGHSDYQEYYGIKSLDEARAYLDHKLLGHRLREITGALLQLEGYTTIGIFGNIDSMKVRSCMTLFDIVSPHDIFEGVLDKYYNGERCKLTLERVAL